MPTKNDLIQSTLEEYFGFNSFRPGQRESIFSLLNGQDTLVVMPTGGGKSLCYQLPSLLFDPCFDTLISFFFFFSTLITLIYADLH